MSEKVEGELPSHVPTGEQAAAEAMLVALHNPRECQVDEPTHVLAVKLWAEEDMEALLQEFAKLADEAAQEWAIAGNGPSDKLVAACFAGAAQRLREAAFALYASTK